MAPTKKSADPCFIISMADLLQPRGTLDRPPIKSTRGVTPTPRTYHTKSAAENFSKNIVYTSLLTDFKDPAPPLKGLGHNLANMYDESLVTDEEAVIKFQKPHKAKAVKLSTKIWSAESNEFDKRCVLQAWLQYLFGKTRKIDFEVGINDGSSGRIDLLIKKEDTVCCLVELKSSEMEMLDHRDQIIRYAACLLRDNPTCPPFSLVLTNGDVFYVGLARWSNHRPRIEFDVNSKRKIKEDYDLF